MDRHTLHDCALSPTYDVITSEGDVVMPPGRSAQEIRANARLILTAARLGDLVAEAVPGGIGPASWESWLGRAKAALDDAGIPWRPEDRAAGCTAQGAEPR